MTDDQFKLFPSLVTKIFLTFHQSLRISMHEQAENEHLRLEIWKKQFGAFGAKL